MIRGDEVSRASLRNLILAAILVAFCVALLLRGGSDEPTVDHPVQRSRPSAESAIAPAPVETPETTSSEPTPTRRFDDGPPPPQADNVKTGEEGALSPTRTAVRLYGNARVKPLYNLHDSTLNGVQISNVTPGSFWEELGVEDGDIILELNGELIDTPAASVKLMNEISRAYVLNLRLQTLEGNERFIDYRTPETH